MTTPDYIDGPHGRIAYARQDGDGPGIVWLGGFRSDMTGTKASALHDWAATAGRAFLRFDYSGHGASDGDFEDGCISHWLADAARAIDTLTDGPQILVGSSMGGWITALYALQRPEKVAAIVFIAPAPDFTEKLMWANLKETQQRLIMEEGRMALPSFDDEPPTAITRNLIEDGRQHLIMDGPIAISAPVRILQGMQDTDVPWRHAVKFADLLQSDDVIVTLSKAGGHRLSTPEDIARLKAAIEGLAP